MHFSKKLAMDVLNRLPPSLKRSIVNVGFNVDRDHFQTLASRHLFAPDMRFGLEFLRDNEVSPKTILDIGAYEGDWARLALQIWPNAQVTMIEANPVKAALLRQVLPNLRTIECLLGPNEAEVPFYVMESGSSVLEENSPLDRKQIMLGQRTLDSLRVDADLIKMDVQGYELKVLEGGLRTLSQARAVVIELSLIEINQGCPLLDEAFVFMRREGFVAYDIVEFHRRPLDRAMNQIDVLFLKENDPLRRDKRHFAA